MIIIATQIRVGMILNMSGELYRVTWMQHVTPGKGVACVQTKLKNIFNEKNMEQRFRSNDKVDKADLETRQMQYLFQEGDGFVFMDNETFEQYSVSKEMIGESSVFLQGETVYHIQFYNSSAVSVEFPTFVEVKVTFAPKEIKRATATAQMRPVELENGMSVSAPAFIKEGDVIRISTATHEYMERAN